MTLSIVIITYNEERNIERCIKSVINIADEIVVVDSYSTDRTVEICHQYNVKVVKNKFESYGKQKRFAAEQAKFDYILSLDADEALSSELNNSIEREKKLWSKPCYSFNRRNFYCGTPIRYCGWYPDRHVRLFDRNVTNWTKKDVHESIDVHSKKMIKHLNGDLLHYTCSTMAEHKEKEKKYARMNGESIAMKNQNIFFLTPYIKGSFRFFKIYIIKLGILDGFYGFEISKTLAKSSFLKYSVARKLLKTKS